MVAAAELPDASALALAEPLAAVSDAVAVALGVKVGAKGDKGGGFFSPGGGILCIVVALAPLVEPGASSLSHPPAPSAPLDLPRARNRSKEDIGRPFGEEG